MNTTTTTTLEKQLETLGAMREPTVPPSPVMRSVDRDAHLLGDQDLFLFNEGTHTRLYDKLGAHVLPDGGVAFAVWAPNAEYVSVIGNFNGWDKGRHPMTMRGSSGLWELVVPEAGPDTLYKYHIASRLNGFKSDKVDPFGFKHAKAPFNESIVTTLDYDWHDAEWMKKRESLQRLDKPMSIYEMHIGSWMRNVEEDRPLTYSEMAPKLAEYLHWRGFTHVEFLR